MDCNCLDIIYCARNGNPWSLEKYLCHVKEIERPYVCNVGDYRVATGGIDKTACFKTLAGEIISGAISGNKVEGKKGLSQEELLLQKINKQKKMNQCQTENTTRGSDGMTAERRLTHMKVTVDHDYWEINSMVVQEKLKNFLKLWYFPSGGGKLSKTKEDQLNALKAFNLTKEGVDDQIDCCSKQHFLI